MQENEIDGLLVLIKAGLTISTLMFGLSLITVIANPEEDKDDKDSDL
jgi:hypothetical protein